MNNPVTVEFRHNEGVELSSLGYYEHAGEALRTAETMAVASGGVEYSTRLAAIHTDLALNSLRRGEIRIAEGYLAHAQLDLRDASSHVDRQDLIDRSAARVTALGRLATVAGRRLAARAYYRQAHDMLKDGGNTYFLTNNDILAAREARIAGRPLDALGWVALAAKGVYEAWRRDRPNLRQAAGTFLARLPDTLTWVRAQASLNRTKPIAGRVFNV